MAIPWNKGLTKSTSASLQKTSITLSNKKRSNFWKWQQENKVDYVDLIESEFLAEFYGTMLGDGCIEKFPRTDKITISFNRKEQKHLIHVSNLIKILFNKEPKVRVRKNSKCDDLYIYQKYLAKRLKFPYGKKLNYKLAIPGWIKNNSDYLRVCLKALFETDGNWHIDQNTGQT